MNYISMSTNAYKAWSEGMLKAQGRKGSYVAVGSGKANGGTSAFRSIRMPDGNETHVMSRRVFESALDKANDKLRKSIKNSEKIAS
jgi:hypothetical protein